MKAPKDDPKGYTDPGEPVSNHSQKRKQLAAADLLDQGERLEMVENLAPSGHSVGGFLKRNNFSDRF